MRKSGNYGERKQHGAVGASETKRAIMSLVADGRAHKTDAHGAGRLLRGLCCAVSLGNRAGGFRTLDEMLHLSRDSD